MLTGMKQTTAIEILKHYYSGFQISRPVGNNAFSYKLRVNKQIYVPPIRQGSLDDLKVGYHIGFSEVDEGVEHNELGLANFIYFIWNDIPVYIFDNHNHAFFFWMFEYWRENLPAGLHLVHVDQHSDMWKPEQFPEFTLQDSNLPDKAFKYANFVLNVGNFIKPALHLKLFSDVSIITGTIDFELKFESPIVFDLDMDVFAPIMDYIGNPYKIDSIRQWMKQAKVITIATSPYFMNQPLAFKFLQKIFAH